MEDVVNCSNKDNITRVLLINRSDLIVKNGSIRLKRKYGKLKKEVIEYKRNENE